MNHDKLLEIIQGKNIIIPLSIYKYFPKLNIDLESFIFLMYLYSRGSKISFNINELSEEYFVDTRKIMEYISVLQDKKLLEIKVIKNEKNIMEEYIYLDLFYKKISMFIINEEDTSDKKEEDEIFDLLQKDVGLQLSLVEVEIVKQWKYDKEVIKEAVNEAIKNKVASIKYIDKVLYNWTKEGIKTVKDLENKRKGFKSNEEKKEKVDVFDYDWIEDDE